MPTEIQQQAYDKIMGLFDRNERILDAAEKMGAEAEKYIPNINKLLLTVEDNAEILVDNFLKYMKSGKALSGVEKLKIEKALKAINDAVTEFDKLQTKKH